MTIEATVGTDHFLENKYLSIGINGGGTLGTRANAPAGIATAVDIGYIRVGLYADFDGFGVGKAPGIKDVMLEGTPVEGFSVSYRENGTSYIRTNHDRAGAVQIQGTGTSSASGSTAKAAWSGSTGEGIKIDQNITLTSDAKYMRVDVTITNNSTTTASDVRYMRTIDPDQGSGFETLNKVVQQGGGGKAALVAAYETDGSNPFFYYSKDARAQVSAYGFDNRDPAMSSVFASLQPSGYSVKGDIAVNLSFTLGTLAAGASTTVTYYMGVTDDLSATVASIGDTGPVNTPPVAGDDGYTVVAGAPLQGNVLTNDHDANGDVLRAALQSGPANGTVTLTADGHFTYTPKAGFVGTDTFVYSASDGKASDLATVKIEITGGSQPLPTDPDWRDDPLLKTAGFVSGSSSANQTLSGVNYHNVFFVNVATTSGDDRVTNFQASDILAVNHVLGSSSLDIVTLSGGRVRLDGATGSDVIELSGITALRHLGTTTQGLDLYADAATRPQSAIEGTIGNDVLKGDAGDKAGQTFFFDTALGLDLGSDKILNFGARDIFVTTSKLLDGNHDGVVGFGRDQIGDLVGGSGAPTDHGVPGEAGHVTITDSNGARVTGLEYDGTVIHDGVAYYVYSELGSAAGTGQLHF